RIGFRPIAAATLQQSLASERRTNDLISQVPRPNGWKGVTGSGAPRSGRRVMRPTDIRSIVEVGGDVELALDRERESKEATPQPQRVPETGRRPGRRRVAMAGLPRRY